METTIPWNEEDLFVVFDYETSGLHRDDGAYPATLGLKWGDSADEQIAIPIDQGPLDKPGTTPTLFGNAPNVTIGDWAEIHEWMQQQWLIGHGAKADLWFAWCGLRKDRNCRFDLSSSLVWDTMVVESLLNPNQRVSIELVAARYDLQRMEYGIADQAMRKWAKKNKIEGDIRYDIAPWDILEPYLLADVERTWNIYQIQKQRVYEGEISRELLHRELDLIGCLFGMEERGLPYDVERSVWAANEAAIEMTKLEKAMPFDPSSRESVNRVFKKHGVKINAGEGKSGFQGSINQEIVREAVSKGAPGAVEYQRWVKLRTARSLWYAGWSDKAGEDGRVRADYRQVKTWEGTKSAGTVSGRFAVSRVNVQSIPRPDAVPDGYPTMQSLIRAKPPNEVYEVDISQAEMRVVASLSGCEPMLNGFREGFDAHDSTTRLIWNVEPDADEWDQRRQVAKRLGFGVIYGAGIRTLAEQIRIFTGEDLGYDGVKSLWDQYREAFPELFRYSYQCKRQVETSGYLVLPGGKVRAFHPNESTHKSMNAMIQGGVAVAMTQAMLDIDREIPGILIGQVHDSVLIETHRDFEADRVARIVEETFEGWFPNCPFVADAQLYSEKR